MGAFNIVTAKCLCPICGETGEFVVQFKFGDTWQHHYQLGDILSWGGNDIGVRGARKVRVEGFGGPCPNCNADNLDADVFINEDCIMNIAILGKSRLTINPEGFEVVDC